MNKLYNALYVFALTIFLCAILYGCDNESVKTNNLDSSVNEQDSIKTASKNSSKFDKDQIQFTDSVHFQMVKQYIEETGKHHRLSASAVAGDTNLMVDYYSILREGWEITKDHHSRIYFSYDSYSYGSIFLENDSVHVEPYYVGPRKGIDTLGEIIQPITKLYNELIDEAGKE